MMHKQDNMNSEKTKLIDALKAALTEANIAHIVDCSHPRFQAFIRIHKTDWYVQIMPDDFYQYVLYSSKQLEGEHQSTEIAELIEQIKAEALPNLR